MEKPGTGNIKNNILIAINVYGLLMTRLRYGIDLL